MGNWLEGQRGRLLFAGFILSLLAACGGLLALSVYADRQAVHYPQARHISSHSVYRPPLHYRWDDSFATDDPINLVYEWYSVKFELGAESRANGSCSLIEDTKRQFRFERYIGVLVCETGGERLIFINRETSFR